MLTFDFPSIPSEAWGSTVLIAAITTLGAWAASKRSGTTMDTKAEKPDIATSAMSIAQSALNQATEARKEFAAVRERQALMEIELLNAKAESRSALAYIQRLLTSWVSPPDPEPPPDDLLGLLLADADGAATKWFPKHRNNNPLRGR